MTAPGYQYFALGIQDTALEELFAAVCDTYGYEAMIRDPDNPDSLIPNPQPPDEFTRQHVISHLTHIVEAYRVRQAIKQVSPPPVGPEVFQ